MRELFLPELQPEYAGYVAWRAMLDERDVPPAIHAQLFANYTYCLPPGELFLAYPVPGRNNETEPGQRAYNIVWYRPTTPEKLADLCTDATGKNHGTTIAPPLIRPDVDRLDQGADARAGGAAGGGDFRARPAAVLPGDLRSRHAAGSCSGGWRCLGDAAFLARPHPGAGTTKGALDAACLADAIAEHGIEAGLARYQRAAGRLRQRHRAAEPHATAPISATSSSRAASAATRT